MNAFFKYGRYTFAIDDIGRVVLDCGQLHQAVGTILRVQVEHPEDQRESGEDTETDTEPPVNTYHIEDDEQQENGQQAPDKEVQVLCLQAVEFHVAGIPC